MLHRAVGLPIYQFAQLDTSVGTNQHQLLHVMHQLQLLMSLQNLQPLRNLHWYRVHQKPQCLLLLTLDDRLELEVVLK